MSKFQLLEDVLTPPQTPPWEREVLVHSWPEPEFVPEETVPARQYKNGRIESLEDLDDVQEVLLLHAPKQKYAHVKKHPIPSLKNDREMLVQVEVVGLNPIDWKAPDFGFGLPNLPCISGRDLAGRVVDAPKTSSRFKVGDNVIAISTDYRDSRKAAYQQYAVVSDFNACKIPSSLRAEEAAPLGVAFVAAALGLGICIGLDFRVLNSGPRGPDLLRTIRSLTRNALPEDIHAECFDGVRENERAKEGDWIAIWGGSSASGCCAVQLAKLCGLRVIAVIDVARSGERMLRHGADLLVDRLDTERAISIVKSITQGKLRFGLDTRGKETATLLAQAMQAEDEGGEKRAHLVGLTGLPNQPVNGVVTHSVPIKAFHEAPRVGEGLTIWLEKLLEQKLLATPDIEVATGGLGGINDALDRLRDGTVNGPRIVVPLRV
ncbi:Trans-enoyl reductase lepG [Hyphodiscus hymeniophilus]|uniref:Trans-enoyl reductase lepG n=1 Tax=Hyphodiscus hymeniophilus TaxID=353542 RepID=A0A9P6VN09_9HELO|nr:Trans-enoyl reductase lepG [Hyphodiscus hymeniophilus]